MTSQPQSEQDRVVVFDTTLRDGEQSPGATMTHEEKLEIAELLDHMGVDIIEAGFPIASEGDFLAVNEIAKRTKRAVVCGLSRAGQKDIDRCGEAIRPAERGRIHTFISTSPVHMKWKLQMQPEQVFQMVVSSVTRARNSSLEEIVMAMKVRNDVLPFWTGVDATMLTRASKLVSAATSFPVQYNKAIVGRNAFAHESGIHQDGMLKHTQTYEIMTPESVGVKQTSLVMGKHSGRHAFVHKLKELGYELAANQLEDAFVRFKALADRKKHVYDEDIEALVDEEIATAQDRIKLLSLSVIAGTRGPQRATMKLDIDGRTAIEECEGNGPVDAVFNCIKALVPHDATLELYQVHAVTEGTDAQAEVSVRLSENGKSVTAKGADVDTLVASANAYLGALNKLMVKRQRGKPEAMVVP